MLLISSFSFIVKWYKLQSVMHVGLLLKHMVMEDWLDVLEDTWLLKFFGHDCDDCGACASASI